MKNGAFANDPIFHGFQPPFGTLRAKQSVFRSAVFSIRLNVFCRSVFSRKNAKKCRVLSSCYLRIISRITARSDASFARFSACYLSGFLCLSFENAIFWGNIENGVLRIVPQFSASRRHSEGFNTEMSDFPRAIFSIRLLIFCRSVFSRKNAPVFGVLSRGLSADYPTYYRGL
jgi:hypothetical protein